MFYFAELGRFMARDMKPRPGSNLYLYCENNPLRAVDPTGLRSTHGEWTFEPPAHRDEDVKLTFTLDAKNDCGCKKFAMIQIVKTKSMVPDYPWRATGAEWTVDLNPTGKMQSNPFFGMSKTGVPDRTANWGGPGTPASISDPIGLRGELETCAICIDPMGIVLGCQSWSYDGKKATEGGTSDLPSSSWSEAITGWNDYAKKKGLPAIPLLKKCDKNATSCGVGGEPNMNISDIAPQIQQ